MARPNQNKRQHFVPRSYLSAWCDPESPQEPYVWCYPRDTGEPRKKSPKKLFTETEIYTIRAVGASIKRDLRIEQTLSELEQSFVGIRSRLLSQKKTLPVVPKVKLIAFFAAMYARTPVARRRLKSQWAPLLKVADDLATQMKSMNEEEKRRMPRSILGTGGPSLSHKDVRELVENPLQATIEPMIAAVTRAIFDTKMNVCILCTDGTPGFITSDDPCTWYDPKAYQRPPFYRGVALQYKTVELTMPISPNRLLLISHMDLDAYLDVPTAIVDDLNRRTRFFCDKTFVVSRQQTKPIWYEPGEPIED